MKKQWIFGLVVAAIVVVVVAFAMRNTEPKAAARLQACWEERKRAEPGKPPRKCMAETEEYLAVCQKSASKQACIDRVGALLSAAPGR